MDFKSNNDTMGKKTKRSDGYLVDDFVVTNSAEESTDEGSMSESDADPGDKSKAGAFLFLTANTV